MSAAPPSPADVRTTTPTLIVIQDKIRRVFDELVDLEAIVQFWAPVKTTGGRWLLTTSDQPFALAEDDEGFRKYRSCSVRYQYDLDKNKFELEVEEDPAIIFGAPATAFLNRLPELLPNLSVCSNTPLETSAVKCGVCHSVMVPVFDPSESSCVGVVECSTTWCDELNSIFNDVCAELEKVGLKTFHAKRPYETVCGLANARDEINKALEIILPKFCLSLIQVWIAYKDEKHVPCSSSLEDNRTERMLGIKLLDHYSDHDLYGNKYAYQCTVGYRTICRCIPLKLGEGPIGKTLKNHKPHFIKKVSRLIDNQPLMMVRHTDGEGDPFEFSCFVICLRNIHTGDFDYVFEFLWREVPRYVMLLESLLPSLKTYLPNFTYASGGELGDDLPIIYVEDSKSKTKIFRIFKGNKPSWVPEALDKRSSVSVGKECSTPLDENTVTIKAEHAGNMIKFTLPISSATFLAIDMEIGKRFVLHPANYKINYLDEDGDWILLRSDEDLKVCLKGRRNLSSIVRLRLLPRQPSDPPHIYR